MLTAYHEAQHFAVGRGLRHTRDRDDYDEVDALQARVYQGLSARLRAFATETAFYLRAVKGNSMKCDFEAPAFLWLLRVVIVCLVLAACADARTNDGGRDDNNSLPGEFDGSWKWAGSTGGAMAQEVTPNTSHPHQRYLVQFDSGRQYSEISSEGKISFRGVYSLARGVTFEEPSDTVLLLQLQRPLWAGYFSPATEFAVRVRGDTLELVESSSHAWMHRFVRAGRNDGR